MQTKERFSIARSFDGATLRSPSTSSQLSAAGWYWNRLRRMSPAEVAYRIGRALITHAQQLGWTTHDVPVPVLTAASRPFVANDAGVSADAYVAAADRLLAGRTTIFDIEVAWDGTPPWNRDPKTARVAPLVFGKTLNYRDSERVGDIKYLWELNRHLHLVTIAQAYRLRGDTRYLYALQRHLESWMDQCPYLRGPNWTSSLELSIRLINWSVVWQLIGGRQSPLFDGPDGKRFLARWLETIYRHQHFVRGHLSKFSSANNNWSGEAGGLSVAATTWPYWPASPRWRDRARRVLVREALRQNAPDGVNREQAIAYQQFVLDFLLLAALAGRHNGDEFPVSYWSRMEAMLEFIAGLMDVGGRVPMIGDADDGYVTALSREPAFSPFRSLLATGAVLFGRPEFKAKAGGFDDKSHWLLGEQGAATYAALPASAPSVALRRSFPDGGYYVLGGELESAREIRIVADCGPLGYQSIAAHGHADALAFTLSIAGEEFLIDPGTYVYHTERAWRDYFRGTAAHNTVRVDGLDQSVIGGSFLWARHAVAVCTCWDPGSARDRLVGWHNGYMRLPDPVRHERELVYDKAGGLLLVSDRIDCRASHRVERFWHFAEDVAVRVENDGSVLASKNGRRLQLVPESPVEASCHCGAFEPTAGWVSRRFDVKQPSVTVVWANRVDSTTRLNARVECHL